MSGATKSKPRPLHLAIENSRGERAVHRELEQQPWVVARLCGHSSNPSSVISRFKLGNEYEADFVVLHGFSGGWDVDFIELEPPSMSPFNKKGDFSARMNHAAGQIRRWKEFEHRRDKQPYLTSQLRDAALSKDLVWQDGKEPTDSQGHRLTDPICMLLMHYHIVMGRRHHLDADLWAMVFLTVRRLRTGIYSLSGHIN